MINPENFTCGDCGQRHLSCRCGSEMKLTTRPRPNVPEPLDIDYMDHNNDYWGRVWDDRELTLTPENVNKLFNKINEICNYLKHQKR